MTANPNWGVKMFMLGGSDFPRTTHEFVQAMEQGLRIFELPQGRVSVTEQSYPRLRELTVDLTGGKLPRTPQISRGTGKREPGVEIDHLNVRAAPIHYENAPLDLMLRGDQMRLDFDRNRNGQPVVTLGDGSGCCSVELKRSDLEAIFRSLAQAAAQSHGITIKEVALEISALGPRAVAVRTLIAASKLFLSATLIVRGQLNIDEHLNARLSGLACEGEGMLGSLASNLIAPRLTQLENQVIPLSTLTEEHVRFENVSLSVGDAIRVEADFRC